MILVNDYLILCALFVLQRYLKTAEGKNYQIAGTNFMKTMLIAISCTKRARAKEVFIYRHVHSQICNIENLQLLKLRIPFVRKNVNIFP